MIDVVLADIAGVRANGILHPVSAEWDPVIRPSPIGIP